MEHTARILSPTLPPELRYVTESMNMLALSLIIDDSIYSGLFLTIEIRWDTRCKKASRGYGQGATEVNWESNISVPVHCFLAWENVPMLAIVPPWRILRRFWGYQLVIVPEYYRYPNRMGDSFTVCSFWMSNSKLTKPGLAAVTWSWGGISQISSCRLSSS